MSRKYNIKNNSLITKELFWTMKLSSLKVVYKHITKLQYTWYMEIEYKINKR